MDYVVSVVFDYDERTAYHRLGEVFAKSVELNWPEAQLVMHQVPPPLEVKKNSGMSSNHYKFKFWSSFVEACQDGDRVVMMDADTVVLQSLSPAYDQDFDIALTRRTSTQWPYNGGVVFVRVNNRSRAFIRKWGEIDEQMYLDDDFHQPYKRKYKGQNQASLGWMVEHDDGATQIVELPCAVWNACNDDWMRFGPHTRVLHVKSQLRRAVLRQIAGWPSAMRAACRAWQDIADVVDAAKGE
jgi:hypothetical protein